MNGLGTNYLTNKGLAFCVRAIAGLTTDTIDEGASGTGTAGHSATSEALNTEIIRDDTVVTWDGTNAGPVFTVAHAPITDSNFVECGLFNTSGELVFVHDGYMAGTAYGATLGDTLTNTITLAFKDSSE